MSAARASYHHGNLRNALIIAAAELIERDNTLDFSIAEAAERVGVSAAAPYRHFADKENLLAAVRDLAFVGLDTVAAQTAARAPGWLYRGDSCHGALLSEICPRQTYFLFIDVGIARGH